MKTKYITKTKELEGLPKASDFKIVEEDIDENLTDGEVLTEAVCISVDPFIRVHPIPPGIPVIGFQVGKVLASKNEKYLKGNLVMHLGGWKTICKVADELCWYRVDNVISSKDITKGVGVVGMPGIAAYFGFLDFCQPKEGETVMVNGCAGAVGSFVGQIAKIKGCKVVGCCGSDEKVAFAKSLGFDEVFNYKTEKSWPEAIKRCAPNGIDCFFDNVGGQLASDIINQMNTRGRIACCGFISTYNSKTPMQALCDTVQPAMVSKQLRMEGFEINEDRFKPRYPEGVKQMSQWFKEGKIKVRETVTEGFENTPKAFIGMLSGDNIGKAVVRVN
ncbi:unnamed protein product [Clavelina lepadiformis]|uniref:Prostaglandin reductase 1 n=1 Tax=Clavelina lepadiformis TaxID=159417 RepID=A0ABP0GD57_CLALP